MTLGTIFFSIAILGIVGLYVAKPLLQPRFNRQTRISRLGRLQIQKEALLIQISDLDFDHETGKLTEDDFQHQRSELMAEATLILQQIDKIEGQSTLSEPTSADEMESISVPTDIDAEIEAAVAQIRVSDAATEELDIKQDSQEKHPSQNLETERIFCGQCGQAADYGDKFCTICGHALTQPQHA